MRRRPPLLPGSCRRLAHERGGEREPQFHLRAAVPLLPAWHEGRLRIIRWGERRGGFRHLPRRRVDETGDGGVGQLVGVRAEAVDVPAALALDGGVWFVVRQGLRGVLVPDERGGARVYVICEPASHYYAVMTRSSWMLVLIGERI